MGEIDLGAAQLGDLTVEALAGGDVHHTTVNHYGASTEALLIHLVESGAREAQRQRLRERVDEIARTQARAALDARLAQIERSLVILLLICLALAGLTLYLLTRQPIALSPLAATASLAAWHHRSTHAV